MIRDTQELPIGWFPVINDAGEEVPPFAVVEITEIDTSSGLAKIGKPSADGQTTIFLNGPASIPTGKRGQVHQTFPAIAAYQADNDDGSQPAHGEEWGAKADSWYLHKGQTGFQIIGEANYGLCNVQRSFAGNDFWAKITAYNDTFTPTQYGWIDQIEDEAGEWIDGETTGGCAAWVRICEVTAGDGAAANEVQSVTIIGATSGTFTLTFDGQTTSALNWNCSSSDIDTVLEALSNITNVTVTGSGTLASPFLVTFTDSFANRPLMTATYSSLQPTAADQPAYEAMDRVVAVGEIVVMRPGFSDPADYRFVGPPLPSASLSESVVTDVTWDEETCVMTKTTKTLSEIIEGAARCPQ